MVRAGIVLIVVLLLSAPVRADGLDELVAGMRAQQNGDHQGAITHLTLALASAELSEKERAAALVKRGDSYYATNRQDLAHRDYSEAAILNPSHLQAVLSRGVTNYKKGNIDAAIADFDAAEAIEPRQPEVFNNRGAAYQLKGEFERSVRDYDQAIVLAPDFHAALRGRARAKFYMGDFAAAAADYERALAIRPDNTYSKLWLYVARGRAGGDGAPELARISKGAEGKVWPWPIISLFLGKSSASELLGQARHEDEGRRLQRECEAYFYLGQYSLLHGDREQAADYFRKSVATGVSNFVEYRAAGIELARLGG